MAHFIAIVGQPGTGKTTGVKYLSPEQTYIINADAKPLTFKGAAKSYNAEKKNYTETASIDDIRKIIEGVSQKRPEIKHIIVDTLTSCMLDVELKKYAPTRDQWYDLAKDIYGLIKPLQAVLRNDLFVFLLFHESNSDSVRDIMTNGRKLEKIQLTGLFNTCLFTEVMQDENANHVYKLRTKNDGICKAKSLEDCFKEDLIDNNYQTIVDAINNWYN